MRPLVALALILSGCVTLPVTYRPSDADADPSLTPVAARRQFQELAKRNTVAGKGAGGQFFDIKRATVGADRLELSVTPQGRKNAPEERVVCEFSTFTPEARSSGQYFLGYLGQACGWGFFFDTDKEMRDFVRAAHAVSRTPKERDPLDDPDFKRVVDKYRSGAVKPALPEEARRHKVLAEAALREKRFKDASLEYQDALGIAPWWPEGHYNRALILGELRDFGDAVDEMKKYLALVPDATDARQARDKIYEWGGTFHP